LYEVFDFGNRVCRNVKKLGWGDLCLSEEGNNEKVLLTTIHKTEFRNIIITEVPYLKMKLLKFTTVSHLENGFK
jgi:hypothetical protein